MPIVCPYICQASLIGQVSVHSRRAVPTMAMIGELAYKTTGEPSAAPTRLRLTSTVFVPERIASANRGLTANSNAARSLLMPTETFLVNASEQVRFDTVRRQRVQQPLLAIAERLEPREPQGVREDLGTCHSERLAQRSFGRRFDLGELPNAEVTEALV